MNKARDIDWLKELFSKSPLLGSGLLLIISAATGNVPGFGSVELAWKGFLGFTGICLVIAGTVLLFRVQSLGGQALPDETQKQENNAEKKIKLFLSNHQTTELVPREDGLELVFHDVREPNRFRRQFLDVNALKHIYDSGNIKVVPKSSRSPKWGVLTIGPWQNWLYSKELHPNPKDLYVKIYDLIEGIVR